MSALPRSSNRRPRRRPSPDDPSAPSPTSAALSKPFADGKTETARAIEHYTVNWDGKTQYTFSRYKEDEVKDALEELFHGKCAYCESRFAHVAPEDIEHWRPKGGVALANGTIQKPGYYWLAATWSNLAVLYPLQSPESARGRAGSGERTVR